MRRARRRPLVVTLRDRAVALFRARHTFTEAEHSASIEAGQFALTAWDEYADLSFSKSARSACRCGCGQVRVALAGPGLLVIARLIPGKFPEVNTMMIVSRNDAPRLAREEFAELLAVAFP